MTLDVGYRLTDPAVLAGWEHHHDPATADEGELLWSGFVGDIRFGSDDGEIATDFRWVPLLHFGRSMLGVVDRLTAPGSTARYGFTESDQELRFDRSRELVQISASFSDTVLSTSMPELSDAVRRFALRLFEDLTTRYPALAERPFVTDLRREPARPE
jgi:hypothetical protein